MTQKYFVTITAYGEGQLANAAALGIPLQLTAMAVGDAGGVEPQPSRTQTQLINETYRAQINSLIVDGNNINQIIAELVIPETVGGWFVREIGLYDNAGYLFAVANCPPSYKPEMAEGSGRTQVIRIVMVVSSADNITLKIDPAVVIATRTYVDQKFKGRKVKAGTGLAGGGDLSSDVTLAVEYGTTADTAAAGNDPRIEGALQAEGMAQDAGSDADVPMSQKASTDNFALKAGALSVTGTATFTNIDNNINLPGIGDLGFEVGDVIRVENSDFNSQDFTLEVPGGSDNWIVNAAHAGGVTSKSLKNETKNSIKISLLCKSFNAPNGLGQGMVNMKTSRAYSTEYRNETKRNIFIYTISSIESTYGIKLNGISFPVLGHRTLSTVIPTGNYYEVSASAGSVQSWYEVR